MNSKIKIRLLDQAILCCQTLFDEDSKISYSLSKRAHQIFNQVFLLLKHYSNIHQLKLKIEELNLHFDNQSKRENLLNELLNSPLTDECFKTLNEHLCWAGEFGRILPYLGEKHYQVPKAISLIEQIDQLKNYLKMQGAVAHHSGKKKISVLLCFRIDNTNRIRNLLSCIYCIRGQSIGRDKFNIVAVNQDKNDNYRSLIEPFVDKYVFAQNRGDYNFSWSRNIGSKMAEHSDVLVFWDIDIIAPPNMLSQILKEFNSNCGYVIPYTHAYNLDENSSSFCINHISKMGEGLHPFIKAQVMHEIYGMLISVKTEKYFQIGGQDERFEGWGDEDNDFYRRSYEHFPVRRLCLNIYHLNHPRPIMRVNGKPINEEYVLNPGSRNRDIGNVSKYKSQSI